MYTLFDMDTILKGFQKIIAKRIKIESNFLKLIDFKNVKV